MTEKTKVDMAFELMKMKIEHCRKYFSDEQLHAHLCYDTPKYIRNLLVGLIIPTLTPKSFEDLLAGLIVKATERAEIESFELGYLDLFETALEALQAGNVSAEQLMDWSEKLIEINGMRLLDGLPAVT